MRGLRSTLSLFAVLLALGAYVYFVASKRQPSSETATTQEKALAVPPDTIEQITVAVRGGDTTTLQKVGGVWRITAPISARADDSVVVPMTSALRSVDIQRVVDANPSNPAAFGLQPPHVEVAITQSGRSGLQQLLIGDKAPTGGLYARVGADRRLLLVGGELDETFSKSTFDLRSKSALEVERDAIDGLEISAGGRTVRLVRRGSEWRMAQPVATDADLGVVAGLLSKLTTNAMKTVITPAGSALSAYGLDAPVGIAIVQAGSSRATLQVGRAADEASTYARDASRDLVFTIDRALAEQLQKPAAEFRRKDLFLFQSTDATRLEITRKGEATVYEKAKGSAGMEEQWRELSPSPRDIDPARIKTALEKLSFLRAVDFVDRGKTPEASVADWGAVVKYDEGRKEDRVTLRDGGGAPLGARADWPDAAKLDPNAYGLLTAAMDDLKRQDSKK